jgi:hypothetical protein
MIVRIARCSVHALAVGCLLVFAREASAAAQRTFVASTGNDANPCTLAQPCRSFATAIAQTLDGGEILVLDTAGYGPVTITKSVSIIAPPGVYGGISVPTFENGIHINAPGVVVALRGLSINGLGNGQHGIWMQAGAQLHVRDVEISGMVANGLYVTAPASKVYVTNVVARNNAGSGIAVDVAAVVIVDGARAEANGISGVVAAAGANVSLRHATVDSNGFYGFRVIANAGEITVAAIDAAQAFDNVLSGVYVTADGGVSSVDIVRTVLARNGSSNVFVEADYPSTAKANVFSSASSYSTAGSGILGWGTGAVVVATDCLLNENAQYGLAGSLGAQAYTRGNNTVLGNGLGAMVGTTPLGGL